MLSLMPVIGLLRAQSTQVDKWFRSVGDDFEYASLDPNNVPTPVCWVLPSAEKSVQSGERVDLLEISFDVVIAVDRPIRRQDTELDEHLRRYRREVYRRLRGERLATGLTPVMYVSGRILRVTDKDVMWVETYKFSGQVDNYLDTPPVFESVNYSGAAT